MIKFASRSSKKRALKMNAGISVANLTPRVIICLSMSTKKRIRVYISVIETSTPLYTGLVIRLVQTPRQSYRCVSIA